MSMDAPEAIAEEVTENVGALEGTPEGTEIEQAQEKVEQVEEVKNGCKEKKWPGWPGENVFRILVPAHKVGGIIGRKGEHIKKMCEESKARIKILDGPHTMAHTAPERAVMISAKEEPGASISPAMDGLLRVHKRVIDGSAGETADAQSNTGNAVKTRLLAPASQARSLIGKQGSTIKSIQEASNTVVRVLEEVPAFALQDDKAIEIQGESAGVHKAVELIAGQLRKFLVDKGVLPLFESSMSMPNAPTEHMVPPPQPWGHPHGPPPNPGGGYGGSPFMPPPPRPHESFYPPPDLPPMEKTHYGREPPLPMGVHSANQPPPVISQVTQHMQIPLSYADAVIGTSGASISYIRRASGATITIQETRGVPGEMTVEINGSASQVQTAQQLIHNFMAEASVPTSAPPPPVDQGYNYQGHGSNSYMSGPPSAGPGHPAGAGYGSGYGTTYGY